MHEILTVQIGHEANHVATHFWNTQEAYFHDGETANDGQKDCPVDLDRNFRAGLNSQGEETYTPRTIIYDLKGGFGGLRKWGGLYDQRLDSDAMGASMTGQETWTGSTVIQQDTPTAPSEYQQALDQGQTKPGQLTTENVRYWSDYSRVFYHPRSIVQLYEYELQSNLLPFEQYGSGEELYDKQDDILDHDLRPWAEECDQMQGIQVFTGNDDGWAGFADRYVEKLQDEYGKSSVWVFGISRPTDRSQRAHRNLNQAKLSSSLAYTAAMYVPLEVSSSMMANPPLDVKSAWHRSALISAAIETALLPSRLGTSESAAFRLDELAAFLNQNGHQNVAELQLQLPDNKQRLEFWDPASSHSSPHVFSSAELYRALPTQVHANEIYETRSRQNHTSQAYPLPDSFPPIFPAEHELGLMSCLRTSTRIGTQIRQSQWFAAQIAAVEDREALVSVLGDLADAYEYGWTHSDADSDD